MRLSIILLLVSLRCQTAYHIQFHPSNSSTTYIPFTPRHHNSASFVTARQQYGCMSYIPLPYFLTVSRKRPFQNPIHNGFFLMLMLLSGDIHVNPGPINGYSTYPSSQPPYNFAAAATPPPPTAFAAATPPPPPFTPSAAAAVDSGPPPTPPPPPPRRHHHPHADSTNNKFKLCTLNIQSLRHPTHAAEINDLARSSHPPDLFALTETFLNGDTTLAEYQDCIPSGYNLHSTPRNLKSQVTNTTGARGGIAFLTREPSTVLDSPGYCFRSFECASITLKLPNTQLTIFNVYRPPNSSPYSSPPAVFLQEFTTLLSIAATTPHEFLITGDFNIHVDNPSISFTREFLTLLSSTNLTQHVNFPTHYQDHTLDLVVTSSLSNLSPEISFSFDTPSDYYPLFTLLTILTVLRPAPASHSFRRISSINIEAFMRDLSSSDLVLNPLCSLDDLLCSYNATLFSLLDKHAPIITKSGSHSNNPWYTSYLQAFKSFRRRLERTYVCYKRTRDPQLLSELKSATNRYH